MTVSVRVWVRVSSGTGQRPTEHPLSKCGLTQPPVSDRVRIRVRDGVRAACGMRRNTRSIRFLGPRDMPSPVRSSSLKSTGPGPAARLVNVDPIVFGLGSRFDTQRLSKWSS